LLKQLTKTVIESALAEEMTEHLGYEKHDPAGAGTGNVRNGARGKTVHHPPNSSTPRYILPGQRSCGSRPRRCRRGCALVAERGSQDRGQDGVAVPDHCRRRTGGLLLGHSRRTSEGRILHHSHRPNTRHDVPLSLLFLAVPPVPGGAALVPAGCPPRTVSPPTASPPRGA
jgi:hypothetical protein